MASSRCTPVFSAEGEGCGVYDQEMKNTASEVVDLGPGDRSVSVDVLVREEPDEEEEDNEEDDEEDDEEDEEGDEEDDEGNSDGYSE
jgi:hypothetical protein